jgi:outer membrane protein assembly factor BamB
MEGHKKHQKNSFATSTPTTDGERIYVVFTSPAKIMVHCIDAAGRPVWERDLGPFKGQHGSGASPILYKDHLIVSNEQDGPSFIASLDKFTGKTRWQTPRASEIVAYSTPFVLADEKMDLLVVSSKAGLAAMEVETGKPVWHCSLFKQRVVASPILAGSLVVAHSGSGNKGERMIAVRPGGQGDVSGSHVVWQETKTLPYCPSPLAFEGRLYTIGDSGGLARCMDAKTGKELWHERLEGNFSASPIRAGGKIFLVGEKGLVFVIAAGPKFELLGKNAIDDYFVATPAVAGNRLYLRGESNLWCIGRP